MEFNNPLAGIKWKRIFGLTFLVIALGVGGYVFYNYGAVYSDGYRDGTLIKFSRKGFIFKTYEGELNQGGIANSASGTALANQIWKFSVKDETTADKLNRLGGKVVRLHYKQYVKNFIWEGETNYLVDEVEEVK
ncbi:MAG: 6-phosphogluconate dehydrogenase [Bacteroidetes bacterium]|nr:6-phosphogluconate dehydrogenase [Bacteroidota bacterium]